MQRIIKFNTPANWAFPIAQTGIDSNAIKNDPVVVLSNYCVNVIVPSLLAVAGFSSEDHKKLTRDSIYFANENVYALSNAPDIEDDVFDEIKPIEDAQIYHSGKTSVAKHLEHASKKRNEARAEINEASSYVDNTSIQGNDKDYIVRQIPDPNNNSSYINKKFKVLDFKELGDYKTNYVTYLEPAYGMIYKHHILKKFNSPNNEMYKRAAIPL